MTDRSDEPPSPAAPPGTLRQKVRAYSVHIYTASGVAFAFLAAAETCAADPDPRWVFLWLTIAVLIDASDGPLARLWDVKTHAARIDGRTIDDILDYLTFTFVPLLLVWRMGWLGGESPGDGGGSEAAAALVAAAMIASLLGFANTTAKQEAEGFFLGFPSYWNIYAFYAGLSHAFLGPTPGIILIVTLTILTVTPVRFIYPNLAPTPWKPPLLIGAAAWLAILLAMLPAYPQAPPWLVGLSLVYPAFYVGLSVYLDLTTRRRS